MASFRSGTFFTHQLDIRLVGKCRLFFTVFEPPELDGLGLFLALAVDEHRHVLADRRVGNDARQIADVLDVLAVELDDHVAGLDAGRLVWALLVDASDQRTARRLDAEAFRDFVGHLLDAYAEPAASSLTELFQLINHRDRGLRGYREANADRA